MQDGQVNSGGIFDRHGETKAGHTKLCIGLQGFACFSKMGRVSAVLVGYVIDLEGSSRNF